MVQSLCSCVLLRMRCKSAGEAVSRGRFALSKERSDSTSGDSGFRGLGFSENSGCSTSTWSSGMLTRTLSLAAKPDSLRAFFMEKQFCASAITQGLLPPSWPTTSRPGSPHCLLRLPTERGHIAVGDQFCAVSETRLINGWEEASNAC